MEISSSRDNFDCGREQCSFYKMVCIPVWLCFRLCLSVKAVCNRVCVCELLYGAWTPVTMFDRCTHAFAIIYTLQTHRFGHPLNRERERERERVEGQEG